MTNVDALLDASDESKVCDDDGHLFAVRAAYQTPIMVALSPTASPEEALPYTFEDALVLENLSLFANLQGAALVAKFRKAIADSGSVADLGIALFDALRSGTKAEFVLDVISSPEFEGLTCPAYIVEALQWLEVRLRKKQTEILPGEVVSLSSPDSESISS
jgi:hypothetical protein